MVVRYSLGIDPGVRNFGFAIVKQEEGQISLVKSVTLCPLEMEPYSVPSTLIELIDEATGFVTNAPIAHMLLERYVSYQNVQTPESENILMLIGMVNYGLHSLLVDARPQGTTELVRAIQWKTELVRLLVKNKGFDNPSSKLDKVFSVAAAHACLDIKGEFTDDHQGDAVCLACLPLLRERYGAKKK